MTASEASRRDVLRKYFQQVATDLVHRGVIRRARGQGIDQVVRAELDTVLKEVSLDFSAVLIEMGVGAAEAAHRMLSRQVEGLVSDGLKKLGSLFAKR